ncbi:MAG TPA: peptide deformylase [Terrimicrobiaceae bacterium]|nr:peptide deformylase [Terrimicrobiaceae bacterium]
MILEIVQYGHPALRAKGQRIEKIDDKLRDLVEDMLDTMVDANGVGLAAQQIGRPIQLCVVDVTGVTDRPSAMRVAGRDVDVEEQMPLVLINPEVETFGPAKPGAEGCLSFPGLGGKITRPYSVRVKARTLDGSEMDFEADGLLARAIQHEHDHLHGILYIDRMEPAERKALEPEIEQFRNA